MYCEWQYNLFVWIFSAEYRYSIGKSLRSRKSSNKSSNYSDYNIPCSLSGDKEIASENDDSSTCANQIVAKFLKGLSRDKSCSGSESESIDSNKDGENDIIANNSTNTSTSSKSSNVTVHMQDVKNASVNEMGTQSRKNSRSNVTSSHPSIVITSSENGNLMDNVHDAESLKSSLSEIGHFYTAPASSNDLATRPESMQELNQKPLDSSLKSESFSNIQVLPGKIYVTSALSYKNA